MTDRTSFPPDLSPLSNPQRLAALRATGLLDSPAEEAFDRLTRLAAQVLDDAREHPLLRDNPAVTEGGVVAYAGMPLVTAEGHALGSLCVVDFQRRGWSERDVAVLREFAAALMAEVQVRAMACRVRT